MDDTIDIVKDSIMGDPKALELQTNIDIDNIHRAMEIIARNPKLSEIESKYLMANLWRPIYKQKPPTPEEFLSPEWLGPTSLAIRPWVREAFLEIYKPNSQYKNVILGQAIRSGKSFLTSLIMLYTNILLYLMYDPKKFLKQSPATVICSLFVSYSQEKVTELLIEPVRNIIDASPKFEKCKTIEQMERREKEYNGSRIVWTTAGDTNILTMGRNGNLKIASSATKLLGLAIITGAMTELSFFKERGYTDAKIMNLYNSMKGRVHTSFPHSFMAKTILDTSPADASHPDTLDYWIRNEAVKKPENYILTGPQWKYVPSNFPLWNETKETFKVFMGSNAEPAKIISDNEDFSLYNTQDVIDVPIDIKTFFEDDLHKSLRDLAGIPTGNLDRILTDNSKIEKIFDNELLPNYNYLLASELQDPEFLLWEPIRNKYFIKTGDNQWKFYRHPNAKRTFSIDLSITGDVLGFAMSHLELEKKTGRILDVTDFTIAIIPNKKRINMDAPWKLVEKMVTLGGVNIIAGSFDQFQSESGMQALKRLGINMEILSADRNVDVYLNFISSIQKGTYKCGKSIFLKNNLKSLKYTRTPKVGRVKIDHELGKVLNTVGYSEDWDTSGYGLFGKDVSDATSASLDLLRRHHPQIPESIWEDLTKDKGVGESILKKLKLKY